MFDIARPGISPMIFLLVQLFCWKQAMDPLESQLKKSQHARGIELFTGWWCNGIYREYHGNIMGIYTGWWCNFTILKNDGVKVDGKDDIPFLLWKITNVWNNQPVYIDVRPEERVFQPLGSSNRADTALPSGWLKPCELLNTVATNMASWKISRNRGL